MKAIVSTIFSLVLLAFQAPVVQGPFSGKVIAVLDGDTIEVMHDGKAERVRLNGIDAPEKSQPFGQASKRFASDKLYGNVVKVVATEKDKYGRTIADVYIGSEWFNLSSVSNGYAWHYKQYSDNKELAEAEAVAKSAKLGLWEDKNPIAPWLYRKSKKTE